MTQLESFSRLAAHMETKHSDAKWFGDSCVFSLDTGEVRSQVCQICGEELIMESNDE